MVDENLDSVEETPVEETPVEETPVEAFDVIYSCLRCATNVSNTELSRLPEIKCICGFRVFTKVRWRLCRNHGNW